MVLLDAATRAITYITDPPQVGSVRWLLIHSGISRRLLSTNYAQRVGESRAAAASLVPGATRLSDVSYEQYQAGAHRLQEPHARRAAHYFSEIARVRDGAEAWRDGDFSTFGRLMNDSCDSSIEQYQSGHPALIALQNRLRTLPGVYGSRFSGGGFGGFLMALVEAGQAEPIAAALVTDDPARRVFVAPDPQDTRTPVVAIIPAAGRGLRLRPLTDTMPKPLLPIEGEPTIVHTLRSLAAAGIGRAIVVTGYRGEQIEQALGDGSRWGIAVDYCHQDALTGTAGAVQTALDRYPALFESTPWLVTAADYALPPGYVQTLIRAHRYNATDATVALKWFASEELSARSSTEFLPDGRISHIIEKPGADKAPSHYVASLTAIFPPGAAAYFRRVATEASGRNGTEVAWTEAVNAMIVAGATIRGIELPAPAEFYPTEQMRSEPTA